MIADMISNKKLNPIITEIIIIIILLIFITQPYFKVPKGVH